VLYRAEPRAGAAVEAAPLAYSRLGQTRDDAAGEAFDKVAKLLALGYPGGPIIDRMAEHGDARAIRLGERKMKGNPYDFSFSGIKTAVLYYLRAHPELEPEIAARRRALDSGACRADQLLPLSTQHTLNLLASFQRAVVEDLVARTLRAAEQSAARSVLVSGGVAANRELRRMFKAEAAPRAIEIFFPSLALSTDNAAMIAAAAFPRFLAGEIASPELNAEAVLPLA